MALSIPLNSTILHSGNWTNGSLFPQIQYADLYAAVYSGNSQNQGLNLTTLSDNIALLTFDASGFNSSANSTELDNVSLASTFALAETLFDPNLRRFPISCVYPLSGQYDTLSRALFYVLMVFSLVFRRHIWISVAALGTAMVYAATSAVHLFALVSKFGFSTNPPDFDPNTAQQYADIDFIGILPPLTASAIMLTPILLWSTTVRKFDAQAIVVWWGVVIFSALACLIYQFNGFQLDTLDSFAICAKDCIPQTNLDSHTFPFSLYHHCNCIDFCGTLSPTAPFRKGAGMVPWFDATKTQKIVDRPFFQTIWITNIIALIFIAIYGVMGLIISRFSPDEVRNGIFRFCNADLRLWLKVLFEGEREDRALEYFNVKEKETHRTIWMKCRYAYAKLVATSFSLTAGATAIICPAVFVSTVIANEFMIQIYPVSEHSDAVGAWGTWVGAGLVLVAAVINKYGDSWVETIRVVLYATWCLVAYSKEDRAELHKKRKKEGRTVTQRLQLFGLVLRSPFEHGFYSLYRGLWTFNTTIHFFFVWWKDTEKESQKRGEAIEKAWAAKRVQDPRGLSGGKPECTCHVCIHDEEKRLEKEKEEEIKTTAQLNYDNSNATSGTVLMPVSAVGFTSSTTSLPLKTIAIDVDELPAKTETSSQERPPLPQDIPLPTPRSTFGRQSTDSMA